VPEMFKYRLKVPLPRNPSVNMVGLIIGPRGTF
jgi:hypothetical protein